jgi:hypothetical protein
MPVPGVCGCMVNRTAFVRSTILVLACACRHADTLAPVDGLGVFSGEWDGAAWRGYGTFDVPVYSSWDLVPDVPGRPVVGQ